MSSKAFDKFIEAVSSHVPPEAVKFNPDSETTVRSKVCYRVRVRGSDMNFEVVGRFAGFTIPDEGAPEVLILEFVSEHSYKDPDEEENNVDP